MIEAKKQFYRAFEERFRGSRENIKEKLKVYLPFIKPLHQKYPEGIVVDIGCGRGEFIELMQEMQISAKGIDLDEGMLEAGLSLGLDMERGDGLSFLRTMEDDSAIVVTAFHVVEHISFDELQDLVSEALRVLKPGGLIILETPNPENIRVSSETFYLDPTHLRPIPSGLLSFITEYYGYGRTKIIRLQESELLSAQKYANISQVLEGVSPDYAIIAQKKAESEITTLLDAAFSAEYGLPLSGLVEKFERRMLRFEEFVDKMIVKAAKAEEFAWKAEIQAAQANEKVIEITGKTKEFIERSEAQAAQANESVRKAEESAWHAEKNAENAWHHYQILVNSRSWKITKPFRYTIDILRRIKSMIKRSILVTIRFFKKYIDRSPKLKMQLLKILEHFPKLKQKLKPLAMPQDILQESNNAINIDPPKSSSHDIDTVTDDIHKAIEKNME